MSITVGVEVMVHGWDFLLHPGRYREAEVIGMGALAAPKSGDLRIEQTGHYVIDRLRSHPPVVVPVQDGVRVQVNLGQANVVFQQFLSLGIRPVGIPGVAKEAAFLAVIHRPARHAVQGLDQHGPVEVFTGGPGQVD